MAAAVVLAFTCALFIVDRTLPQYVDETDNLLGGQLIARGYRLYVDYFSQHLPTPYYFAALCATLVGVHDLQTYRVVFAVVVTAIFGLAIWYFRRTLSIVFLLALVVLIGLGHPIFSGYMVLADHSGVIVLLLLFVLSVPDCRFRLGEQIAISACVVVALQSTLISIYPLALLGVYYVVVRARAGDVVWRDELRFAALLVAPFALIGLGFLWQGMLGPASDQAVVFNQRFYSRYDIGGDPASILRNAGVEIGTLVWTYLRPDRWNEIETVLLVGNLAAVVVVGGGGAGGSGCSTLGSSCCPGCGARISRGAVLRDVVREPGAGVRRGDRDAAPLASAARG